MIIEDMDSEGHKKMALKQISDVKGIIKGLSKEKFEEFQGSLEESLGIIYNHVQSIELDKE